MSYESVKLATKIGDSYASKELEPYLLRNGFGRVEADPNVCSKKRIQQGLLKSGHKKGAELVFEEGKGYIYRPVSEKLEGASVAGTFGEYEEEPDIEVEIGVSGRPNVIFEIENDRLVVSYSQDESGLVADILNHMAGEK